MSCVTFVCFFFFPGGGGFSLDVLGRSWLDRQLSQTSGVGLLWALLLCPLFCSFPTGAFGCISLIRVFSHPFATFVSMVRP